MQEAKLLMRKYNSLLSKNPFNKEFNTQYFLLPEKIHENIEKEKYDYENKLISQLDSLANHDPQEILAIC